MMTSVVGAKSTRVVMLVLLALGARAATAAPLTEEACRTLAAEYAAMLADGIEDTLAKGADWAAANLGPDDFERIFHFLRVEEQVRFRCPAAVLAEEGVATSASASGGTGMPLPLRRPAPPSRAGGSHAR